MSLVNLIRGRTETRPPEVRVYNFVDFKLQWLSSVLCVICKLFDLINPS